MQTFDCPVCETGYLWPFQTVDARGYHRCPNCEATVLDPLHRLSLADERAHYDLHQNGIDDPRYRQFLTPLADWLCEALPATAQGLDFGCGPGSALAALLRERGHSVRLFDPCYAPDPSALTETYDFIFCTEVIEHLHQPAATFRTLRGLLRPGGWLGLMTRFQTADERFAGWLYRRDPTHVVFYRVVTLQRLAHAWGWACETRTPDLALLRKPERASCPN